MKAPSVRWIAIGVAVLVLPVLVYSYGGGSDDGPHRPVFSWQWKLCETGDICVSVPAPCGEWQPANAIHERNASAYYGHLMTVVEETGMDCVSTNLSTRKPAALCQAGACVLSE